MQGLAGKGGEHLLLDRFTHASSWDFVKKERENMKGLANGKQEKRCRCAEKGHLKNKLCKHCGVLSPVPILWRGL